ncbi:low temperature requirement protein A [Streptomyces sp. NPDC020731]|uniref:low temperature requirement protein A n=1 Tax=Streptomyces sp. NPDC020731 TaxID=3365085 RepID=UPI0037AB2BA5
MAALSRTSSATPRAVSSSRTPPRAVRAEAGVAGRPNARVSVRRSAPWGPEARRPGPSGQGSGAVGPFTPAMFAISVAWIGFSGFFFAFATDDWLYRALTMVQMVGVVVFSLGLPAMFHSIGEGEYLELRAMVIGYVVIRIAMVLQWWRAARESPPFHDVGMRNIRWTVLVQLAWIVVGFTHLTLAVAFVAFAVPGALELLLPLLAQGRAGGTPWHPHHVAERYGLFAIITLGEGVVGAVASSGDLLGGAAGTDWSANAVAVVLSPALPVGLCLLMAYLLHTLLLSAGDGCHLLLVSLTLTVLAAAVLLAAAGVGVAVCLLVVMLAPFATVVGYETIGHRHQRRMPRNLRTE